MPALFDLVNAPTPPFLALLRTLQAHVAALDSGMTFDEDGDLISDGELAPSSRRLLHDFRLVQFDVTEGQRFLPESFFADSP
jgi:hypothetical protein